MSKIAVCGTCCWIGTEDNLRHQVDDFVLNTALKPIIEKNCLVCSSVICPSCGSDIVYRQQEIFLNIQSNESALKDGTLRHIEETGERKSLKIEMPLEESKTPVQKVEEVQEDELDVDFVDSVLNNASVPEMKKAEIKIELPESIVVRPPKEAKKNREVNCDRCGQIFTIPEYQKFAAKRCDSCMEALRRLMDS